MDEDFCLLPRGKVGRLLVAGKNLADGYVHDHSSNKFLSNTYFEAEGNLICSEL